MTYQYPYATTVDGYPPYAVTHPVQLSPDYTTTVESEEDERIFLGLLAATAFAAGGWGWGRPRPFYSPYGYYGGYGYGYPYYRPYGRRRWY